MKKQKSFVVFSIGMVLITILLILNAYFEYKHSECLLEIDELRNNNITPLYQESNIAWANYHFLYTNLNILNHTIFDYRIEGDKCTLHFENDVPNSCMKDWREWPLEIYGKIDSVEKMIITHKRNCNVFSIWKKLFLYMALILSLITAVYGWLIYRLYKT